MMMALLGVADRMADHQPILGLSGPPSGGTVIENADAQNGQSRQWQASS
jgi:hypothetical protein